MKFVLNYLDFKDLSIGSLNGNAYFYSLNKGAEKFVFLPKNVFFRFENNAVYFQNKDLKDSPVLFENFILNLKSLNYSEDNIFKKKLRLKGLGFRINVDMKIRVLSLKLGYSHLINVSIPDFITMIRSKKNVMLLEAFDQVALGDFSRRIYDLRKPDIYKGKGFSFKHEKKKLKVIKKK